MIEMWAVIPSGNRRVQLSSLVRELITDGVNVVIVDTGYEPPLHNSEGSRVVIRDTGPKNISRWWNVGIDRAVRDHVTSTFADRPYAVAVLNDDVIVDGDRLRHLARRMFDEGASVAYPDVHGHHRDVTLREPGPVDLRDRLLGCCFVLDPRAGLRADENLVWWYGDDDIDWRARERGGSLLVHDVTVVHTDPNGWMTTNPELTRQVGVDRETFVTKWGRAPW
jgi:hypothetical protein